MSDSEVGNELNIRIEFENEFYQADGDEEVRMEEDEPDPAGVPQIRTDNGVDESAVPVHVQTKIGSANATNVLLGPEDGECSSNSSSGPENMDVDSSGFFGDVESQSQSLTTDRQSLTASQSHSLATETESQLSTASQSLEPRQPRRYPNPYVTGEIQKRVSRALRFGGSSMKFTPNVEELKMLTDDELLNFYVSMGLMIEDGGAVGLDKVNPAFRLDSVLIRGLNNMSTEEIFGYLYDQGLVPQEMEWVNDACCIVIYQDKYEAAASLLKITKPIAMDPERFEKKKSLLNEDKPAVDEDESLSEKDSASGSAKNTSLDYENCSVIPEEAITVPMPLGYVWRYVNPNNDKAKGILMRFAKTDDKKQEKAEKHSVYYKKFGNPNFRPDQNGRHRERDNRTFKRAKVIIPLQDDSSSSEEEVPINNKNAWSVLSASWGKEETGKNKIQNRVRTPIPSGVQIRSMYPMKTTSTSRKYKFQPSAGASRVSSIHHRLGFKEKQSLDDELDEISEAIRTRRSSNEGTSRKRVWSEEEEEEESTGAGAEDGEEDDDDNNWKNRLTAPRMKMHADDEESRQKLKAVRRSQLTTRRTIFGNGRLMPRDDTDWKNPYPRRSIRERLGMRPENTSTYIPRNQTRSNEEDSEDEEDLDAQDLRQLLDRA